MSLKVSEVRPYIGNQLPLEILLLLAKKSLAVSTIVDSVGAGRADVLAWIYEMRSKGIISLALDPPHSESEAEVSLEKDALEAIRELCKPFLNE